MRRYGIPVRVLLTILLTASVARAEELGFRESDGLMFSLEAIGHIPSATPVIDGGTTGISLSEMSPFLHEVGFVFGVSVSQLMSDVVMRVGYRFAGGDLPDGSVLDNDPAARYSFDAVPITVGWRMTFLPYRVRPLLGVDLGGSVARLQYTRPNNDPATSSWNWRWEIRGLVGAHIDAWQWLGVRVFFEGRYTQGLWIDPGPDLDATGLGFGLAVVAELGRPEPGAFTDDPGDKELIRSYQPLDDSRLDRAFEQIRAGDEAAKRGDFIAAAELYDKAVKMLPRDPEAQRNVAAPVYVDLARALIEIGRSDDARVALQAALTIAPDFAAARQLLDGLE